MLLKLKDISNSKQSVLIIALIIVIAITFETFQQLYYIKRFQIADDITFFDILKTQSYRWLIWLIFSFILIKFVKAQTTRKKTTLGLFKLIGIIFSLIFINMITISLIQMMLSNNEFSITELFSEYIPFFTYQKAPIYTLGYIAISLILYLYFENEKLQIEVQQLSELKLTNSKLYQKLRSQVDEKSTVLNIKIGNKRKIIPVDQISWIEADDYCVKVHTITNKTYTMRSSLKALEEKLNTNFLRVHRKAIVNMDLATELHLANTPNLILQNETEVPVSKSNLKTVKDFLNSI
ncbi:LytR/AlgR family response regulator transcription factor [Psychroserpens ponticola]|uniref:LytTR family DNA-binding domain-containing protein n=1 Tax=Psychroserpens ponticola TaxID=2932268 RepID=A0ABY7RZ34_9FLAO|nr:LytTR family DNA-binding domain-containing protein [Psychroserpens ponticola]WCO02408.1 LytTR family DNA-binding domain-containing protein [Psychroserpens ponticola]